MQTFSFTRGWNASLPTARLLGGGGCIYHCSSFKGMCFLILRVLLEHGEAFQMRLSLENMATMKWF